MLWGGKKAMVNVERKHTVQHNPAHSPKWHTQEIGSYRSWQSRIAIKGFLAQEECTCEIRSAVTNTVRYQSDTVICIASVDSGEWIAACRQALRNKYLERGRDKPLLVIDKNKLHMSKKILTVDNKCTKKCVCKPRRFAWAKWCYSLRYFFYGSKKYFIIFSIRKIFYFPFMNNFSSKMYHSNPKHCEQCLYLLPP